MNDGLERLSAGTAGISGAATYHDIYKGKDGIVGCDECVTWLPAEEWWEELEEEYRSEDYG